MITGRGIAYQRDMTVRATYDQEYFERYVGYEGKTIARKLNAGRVDLVNRHAGKGRVLDIGIGSGEFIRSRPNTRGFDVNPKAREWLQAEGLWAEDIRGFDGYTFWDVLEHVPVPEVYFKRMPTGSYVFVALPIFEDLTRIRESRHYRPGEHLYYFTEQGFVDWMAEYRFDLLERSDHESEAGRDSIVAFAFQRNLPGYSETVAQYTDIHSRAYGTSAHLFFDVLAPIVVKRDPRSIIDYGCGRGDLAAHFWRDGLRQIVKYDPAIPEFSTLPKGGVFDLVLCTDVMEHIRLEDVDRVLGEIRTLSESALFTISLKPARQVLPDGRNAHLTLLSADEWLRWIGSVFGKAERVPTSWDHALMVKTF